MKITEWYKRKARYVMSDKKRMFAFFGLVLLGAFGLNGLLNSFIITFNLLEGSAKLIELNFDLIENESIHDSIMGWTGLSIALTLAVFLIGFTAMMAMAFFALMTEIAGEPKFNKKTTRLLEEFLNEREQRLKK